MFRALILAAGLLAGGTARADAAGLAEALASAHRSDANKARDAHRHPAETLTFFGVEPDDTVVEVWPGSGWYTEILAPYLRDRGVYYAAGFAITIKDQREYYVNGQRALADKLASNAAFDHVVLTELQAPLRTTMAPPGTVDVVLTFRNVHNWLAAGNALETFQAFHRALKDGGVLGVVEHRAKPGTSIETMKKTGYVTEDFVIETAQNAGFQLAARAEINANPKDTTDHPAGVWSLPPNLRYCQDMAEGEAKTACIDQYSAIGESDRMTLKFLKGK
jgi:predicted methyltransferase